MNYSLYTIKLIRHINLVAFTGTTHVKYNLHGWNNNDNGFSVL